MRYSILALFAAGLSAAGCSRSPDAPAASTLAQPTPDILLAPTEIAETPAPVSTPLPHTAELVIPLRPPTPVPTVDIASIPNTDRPREPEPRTTRDRLVRCLTFTLSKTDMGPITGRHVVRVEVHARNSCSDVTFSGSEAFFEVRARDRTGQVVTRQAGNFQTPIAPLGESVTYVDILATIDDRLEASVY